MPSHTESVFPRSMRSPLLEADYGSGIYVYTRDGRRYIDACSGALVSNIGHGVQEVAMAIGRQAERLAFAHQSRFGNQPATTLARMVAELAPGDLNHVWFTSGGSEAVESAIKMARQYFVERDGYQSPKHKVIGRWNGFHGVTLGALSVGGNHVRREPYLPMLKEYGHIDSPYCYRCPVSKTYPGCGLACAHQLEELILATGPEQVAAFIFEPIIGAASGAVVPPEGYLDVIAEICRRHDILLIADEVMTGFGRTGEMFAVNHWGMVPDMMCVAKGMSAGYAPLGAVLVSDRVYDVFVGGSGAFVHGHTYGGHPLACAAGVAVLEYIQANRLFEAARARGEYFQARIAELERIPIVGQVRGLGLMGGVELVMDKHTRAPFPRSERVAERAAQYCLDQSVIIYPGAGMASGKQGDQFLLGPPFIITDGEVDAIVEGVSAGLTRLSAELLG